MADVLAEHSPADADIRSVDLAHPDAHWMVRVRTGTPGRLIGRRGATADAMRSAMADRLGDARLQLNIEEVVDPPDPPSGRPPAGDREPRTPVPAAPAGHLEAEPPTGY